MVWFLRKIFFMDLFILFIVYIMHFIFLFIENELEQPSSPSVKKSEEKGIVVVHEVKCKLYVKVFSSDFFPLIGKNTCNCLGLNPWSHPPSFSYEGGNVNWSKDHWLQSWKFIWYHLRTASLDLSLLDFVLFTHNCMLRKTFFYLIVTYFGATCI